MALSPGAIAGIAISTVLALAIIGGITYLTIRAHRRFGHRYGVEDLMSGPGATDMPNHGSSQTKGFVGMSDDIVLGPVKR